MLRAITGHSIVANVGEMIGFKQADMGKVNDFITGTMDNFDFKYFPNIDQKRQWIIMMDGNSYKGVQRDENGNRRFYPMFVGQLPDENRQPAWEEKFKIDFTGFKERIWQILAECRAWLKANGDDKYQAFVDNVTVEVADFNSYERTHDRGTIRDDDLDDVLVLSIGIALKRYIPAGANKGTWIASAELHGSIKKYNKSIRISSKSLKQKMIALGARHTCSVRGGGASKIGYIIGYVFDDETPEQLVIRLGLKDDDNAKDSGESAFLKETNVNPITGKTALDGDEGF
jgi:hypothetical protein